MGFTKTQGEKIEASHILQVKFKATSLGIKKGTQGWGVVSVIRSIVALAEDLEHPVVDSQHTYGSLQPSVNCSPGGPEAIF